MPIAALVNNAGSLRAIGPVWVGGSEGLGGPTWKRALAARSTSVARSRPQMIERLEGRIVNVTSYAGVRPVPYQTGYGCAKAGLASLTESLAASLAQYGIKAFSAAPGFTQTEMTRNLTESEAGQRWLPEVGQSRVVEVERSAQLIALLASGEADELNGRFSTRSTIVRALLANIEEIRREDLYTPRLRRLSSS